MIRTRSLRWLWVGIVVCVVVGAVVLLVGVSTVGAQTHDYRPILNETGNPDPIRIDKSGQNISNIEILLSDQTDTASKIRLYVNLSSIESRGVNTSSASMSIGDIQNGSVINTTQIESENSTLLTATIRPNESSGSIQINSAHISGMDTSNAQKSNNLDYNITVENNTDLSSTEAKKAMSTDSFKIIDGSINIHDQATGSPQLHQDTRTTIGITIDNVSGNTNSTLYITRGDDNEIIGIRPLPKSVLKTKETVSVDTSYPGGDVRGYLIANSTSETSNRGIEDFLPTNMTNSALSTDKGRIVNAGIEFANLSYENPQSDSITVPSAKVSDTIEDETPFLISLHPVNSTGHIRHNEVVANSRVLTGWNEDIKLHFNTTSGKNSILRSNRYAAAIQLARGHSAGDWISPKDSEFLRNSDLNNHFVSDGVADAGVISIDSIRKNVSNSEAVQIKRNQSLETPVFSGQMLYFNSSLNAEDVELHRLNEDNTTRVVSVGTQLNNSDHVGYNTSLLPSGTYYIHSRKGNSEKFNVIGKDRKGLSLGDISNQAMYGNHIRISLSHRVPSLELILSNTSSNTTTTLELTTTEAGPTPVTVNTYASPESPSEFVTTGSGIGVESVTGDTASLSPGTYNLTLRSEHGTEVANDTATVTVEPRSTSDLTAYTTRAVAPGEFENATAVREAIADGTLTPATTATANDTVVYAVNATGLTGLPAAANASLERGADLDSLDGLSFGVAPTGTDDDNESTDGDALGRTPNGSAVHLDREGLYLVADGERAFGTETAPDPGATFEAGFRVDDDRLRRTAADDRHRVTTELAYTVDSTDEGTDAETDGGTDTEIGDDSTEASGSADSETSGSTGTAGGSGAVGGGSTGGGSTGGSSTGGGSTGGPSGSGGAVGPAGSTGAGNVTNASGPGPSEGPPRSDANRSAPRPGVGISIAPGTSEIPPSAGPPELFGTGGPERGADGPAAAGSRSENGRSNDAGGGESDDETSAEPADSAESPESSASSESPDSSTAGGRSSSSESSADEADASDLGYDEAPIRSTAYDLPGFDAVATLAAMTGASLLARRRGRGS